MNILSLLTYPLLLMIGFSGLTFVTSVPIPQNGKHGWSDGPNDGISPGFKQLLEKLKAENPEAAARGELPDPTFEVDGVHKDGTYGWHDGPNDGIPPGFKALLEKLKANEE